MQQIFTDGACTNNGKRSANAAWGYIVVADNGYRVSIVDKLSPDKVSANNRNNHRVFNKSHHIYIHLLNRFSIKYEKYLLKYNEKTLNVLASIINKSKLIPKKSLNTQSFVKFCRSILSITDYNILKNNLKNKNHSFHS
jgi:hypothetical protein